MPEKVDPKILAKLKAGQESLNVEVQFSEPPPSGQLESMGLEQEGSLAWGVLNRERIEAFAKIAQVVSIRLSNRPVASRAAVTPESRIGPHLQLALSHSDRQIFDIVVSFRRPQKSTPPIEGLSVHLDMGDGRLTREAIARLAGNDEVVRIELVPEMHLA
ncbi:MAG TPA: hypothetical protein VKE93_04125 [Candidatus Angelobacter sp.]|nr:hypothetical protein [Candidatus Angelobacter sp.]